MNCRAWGALGFIPWPPHGGAPEDRKARSCQRRALRETHRRRVQRRPVASPTEKDGRLVKMLAVMGPEVDLGQAVATEERADGRVKLHGVGRY